MKRLKIAVLCMVLITGPVVIDSCCGLGCCTGNEKAQHYDIDDVTLRTTPYPVKPPYPPVTVPNPSLNSVAFLVIIDVVYLASVMDGQSGFAAYACSPEPDVSNQTITSILITSNSDFSTTSQTVAAGASLNELFGGFQSYIGSPQLETFSIGSDKVLDKPQTHTFTITITLSDGRVFALVSDRLDLAQG